MNGEIQSLISKGAISVVNLCLQQFIFTLFLVEKGQGTRESPCDQSKGTKQISPEREVQNGGASSCSLSSTQGRLYDETRPKVRLLRSPDTPRVKEISSFPVACFMACQLTNSISYRGSKMLPLG